MNKGRKTGEDCTHMVPYSFDESTSSVRWVNLGTLRFDNPFFITTIQKARRENKVIQTTQLDVLTGLIPDEFAPPSLFIFHVSRCGSTLLSQMLAQSPNNIVLSEPTIVDELLRSQLNDVVKRAALVKSLEALGKKRDAVEEHLIVKFDCWHLLFIDLIKEVFPEVPVLFLVREPMEILNSHRKMRGRQMVPGLLKIPIVEDFVPAYDLDGYAAKVLERLFAIIFEKRAIADLIIDFRMLPGALSNVLKMSKINCNDEEFRLMLDRANFYSKDPLMPKPEIGNGEVSVETNLEMVNLLYSQIISRTSRN